MPLARVPLFKAPNRSVVVNPAATVGATVGTDLVLADGTVLQAEDILNSALTQQVVGEGGTLGVTAGAYGDSTHIGTFQVDELGRIINAANTPIDFSPYVTKAAPAFTGGTNVIGSRGANAALASLLTALAATGLITDGTTP